MAHEKVSNLLTYLLLGFIAFGYECETGLLQLQVAKQAAQAGGCAVHIAEFKHRNQSHLQKR